jgi:pimeloyl-ACP methyl ester carboxylesterase
MRVGGDRGGDMPKVKVGDINLYYEQYGNGDPIIFAHAFLDDCSVWKAQVDALAQKHTVIVFDHRGHGRSDKPKSDYSVQTLANDLYALILELNLDKVALVGNSVGGMTILKFTLDHPDRVSKLVLVCTTARIIIPSPVLGGVIGGLLALVPYGMFARTMQKLKLNRPSQVAINQAVERAMQVPKYAAYPCYISWLTNYDIRRRVSEIEVPTLIVAGEKDRSITTSMTQFLHKAIRGSRLEVIPDCGHVPMVDKPAEFNKILTDFLG